MPHFDIVKECNPERSFRVESIIGTFDLQTSHIVERFTGDIELPKEWNIGLIVERSGSGKTTIARELFGDHIVRQFEYTHESVLDDMPKDVSVQDITKALNSVGFSSPPSWLKRYDVLSNGEKMRCDIARAMLENKDFFVFDEFTSVVDRNVAQIGSYAIQKAIRRNKRKFIAVTCHYDVQDWLMPDWVFNTDTMTFSLIDAETQKKKSARDTNRHTGDHKGQAVCLENICKVPLFELFVQQRCACVRVLCQRQRSGIHRYNTFSAPDSEERQACA